MQRTLPSALGTMRQMTGSPALARIAESTCTARRRLALALSGKTLLATYSRWSFDYQQHHDCQL